jgi:hypothetical protein
MQNGWNPFKKKCVLRIEWKYENEMTQFLKKGDIILHRAMGGNLTSDLIREFTRSPYSHAEIYVGDGWSVSAEAAGLTLSDSAMTHFVDIMRHPGLTEQQVDIIVGKAYQSLAKPYEYFLLLGFPFWGENAAIKRSANKAYICSENAAWCYKQGGIDLISNKPEAIEAPADLGHSKKLDWLGSWIDGQPFDEAERNKIHSLQGKTGKFARWLIEHVADPNSSRDEFYEEIKKSQRLLDQKSA